MFFSICAILTAYLIGSIPTSYIFAKALKGIDIREHGSGNVGATNLSRVAGKKTAIIALILDMAKGIIAVTLVAFLFYRGSTKLDFYSMQLVLGMGAICGHIWPLFLNFKGGKGVATSFGVLFIVAPKVLLIAILVWLMTVAISKYVSLGSIVSSVSMPISAAVLRGPVSLVIFSITLCIITCYKHKSNISRLIRNEEPKIGSRI